MFSFGASNKLNFLFFILYFGQVQRIINTIYHRRTQKQGYTFLEKLEQIFESPESEPEPSETQELKEPKDISKRIENLLKNLEAADAEKQQQFLKTFEPKFKPSFVFYNKFIYLLVMGLLTIVCAIVSVVTLVSIGPTTLVYISTDGTDLSTSTSTHPSSKSSESTSQSTSPVKSTLTTTPITLGGVPPQQPDSNIDVDVNVNVNISPCPINKISQQSKSRLTETRQKCPIGTCSYYDYNLIPPPGTPNCDIFQRIDFDLDKLAQQPDRAELNLIKCENKCGYYTLKVEDFSVYLMPYNLLPDSIPKIKTLTIDDDSNLLCDVDQLENGFLNIEWKNLRWFRFRNIHNDCSDIYKAVATWKTPKLEILILENVYISLGNVDSLIEILNQNSNRIHTLILINITFCLNCRLLDQVNLTSVERIVLTGNPTPNLYTMYQHTIQNLPNLRDLTINNVQWTMEDLRLLAQSSIKLEKMNVRLSLEKDNVDGAQFSLAPFATFCNLDDLTVTLNLSGVDPTHKEFLIKVTDLSELSTSSSIKNLTVVSESSPLLIQNVHKYCPKTLIWTRNPPYLFNCVR